jgi:thiol-disulfide isomerase/thioredoxin
MRKIRTFVSVVVLCVVGVVSLAADELGDSAPELSVAEWVKGGPVSIAEGKGKNIYVVEFWATWCPPCRASIPHLTEMQEKFRDKGVVFVGVTAEDSETVRPFVEKMGEKMKYAVAIDDGRKTNDGYMKAFGVRGIPHAFVVDKEGLIVWRGHPTSGLDQVVEQVVAGTYDHERIVRLNKLLSEYVTLAKGEDQDRMNEVGTRFLSEASDDARILNQVAWFILDDKEVRHRDLEMALKAARKACELTEEKDTSILDTYARALFETGKKDEAIKYQERAVACCTNKRLKDSLEKTLEGYRKKTGELFGRGTD